MMKGMRSVAIVQEMRHVIKEFDTLAIRLFLRYFSIPELKIDDESPSPRAGSHWVYSILCSTSLYWPSENDSYESTNRDQISYVDSHSHESSSIFWSHGWQHPVLTSAMQGSEKDITKWSKLESQSVRRERFSLLRESSAMSTGIFSLAMMSGGYHEALHFLLVNGKESEAISQATASGDVQGLGRLSRDLLPSNLPLSILCMQARCLYAFQTQGSDLSTQKNIVEDAADVLIASIKLHYQELDIVDTTEPTTGHKAPSLVLLSKLTLFSSFFEASSSTAKMQALLDEKKLFESSAPLGLAIIPIVLHTIPLREKD
eukprot:scaffold12151_cov40-Cyclotella_meneghiniana.AAC.2